MTYRIVDFCAHGLAIMTMAGMAAFACVYANPYSLHRVTIADFDQFDAPPGEQGQVVTVGTAIDFRLPRPTISGQDLAAAHLQIDTSAATDARVAACVAFVRQHLNATDRTKPKAPSATGAELLRYGRDWLCQCGEHAILLNEVLQACGIQSRVLWMEGHVTAEYFHEELKTWVFVDAHLNIQFQDADGKPLSVAELIRRFQRDDAVSFVPICSEDLDTQSVSHADADRRWYRNILLNGECYALSGSTLQYPSRWGHLLRFRSSPQMLVLSTPFDTSHAKYIEPFGPHKAALISAAFVAGFYFFATLLYGVWQPFGKTRSAVSGFRRRGWQHSVDLLPRTTSPLDKSRVGQRTPS